MKARSLYILTFRTFQSPICILHFAFCILPFLLCVTPARGAAAKPAEDVVELVTGAKLTGRVTARDDQSVTISIVSAGRTYVRKFPLDRVSAITTGGKRKVLRQPGASGGQPGAERDGFQIRPTSPGAAGPAPQGVVRTRAEVEALIDKQGRTPPDWWDSVPLDFPKSLDLSWPEPAPGGWKNQRNVGQYVWDIINHNPKKWREGVRFMHHLLVLHEKNPQKRQRVMFEMGRMYQQLLQDHARAAFWWRQAGVGKDDSTWHEVQLAECYWKLGNKQMAMELLDRAPPQFSMIKLWADMGQTRRALGMADTNLDGPYADVAAIYAGDACRVAGDHQRAMEYYRKVLAVPARDPGKGRIERYQRWAQANIEAIRLFDLLDLKRVPDGTYRAGSLGYEAQIVVEVAVKSGRIESVRVVEHREKQFYASLTETPQKIIEKQSVRGIDATSNATITSEAIINATAKALSGAMQ